MKNLFFVKSLFDINKYDDFQTLSKEIFIRSLIIIGLPILFFFGIQDLYQSNYITSGIVLVLVLILFFLLFELNRKPEDSKKVLSQGIIIRFFLVIFIFFLLHIIGFEKSLSKLPWFLIFPVLIFSITNIKEALIWTFFILLILIPILFSVDLESSLDEIYSLKIRLLTIFGVLTCVTLITNTIIRLAIENLIDSKKRIQDTNIRLNKEINDRKLAEKERKKVVIDLQTALENIKTLNGLLPICSKCKKIRDDKGYWNNLETYIQKHSNALFTHSICQECSDELYGNEDWYNKIKKKKEDK